MRANAPGVQGNNKDSAAEPALVHEQHIFHTDDGTGLFAYRRSDVGSPTVVVAMNWGEAAIEADLIWVSGTGYAVLSTAEGSIQHPVLSTYERSRLHLERVCSCSRLRDHLCTYGKLCNLR